MPPDAHLPRTHRQRESAVAPLSARKLAASLWRLAATASDGHLGFEFCSSLPIPQPAIEEATKWDSCSATQFHIKVESFKPREDLKHGPRKAKDEGMASSMSTEQVVMRSVVKDLAKKIRTERKICNNIDKVNSDLLRGISEAKSSTKKFFKSLEKEKKAREKLDRVCYDLAKEIEARKAEIEALRDEQRRIQTEVEEERRMLQMAEVWREEQAQMKLNEAKLILENKYAELHSFISGLRAFLRSSGAAVNEETRAEVVRQAFDLVRDMKFFGPKPDKGSAVIEDSRAGEVVWPRPRNGKGMSMDRSSYGSTSNPHVVRAMKGHVEWPWRMKENGTKMLH